MKVNARERIQTESENGRKEERKEGTNGGLRTRDKCRKNDLAHMQ